MKRKIKAIEIVRRVRVATNMIQFYVEELVQTNKIKVWKIAKIFYSKAKADRSMEKLNGTH